MLLCLFSPILFSVVGASYSLVFVNDSRENINAHVNKWFKCFRVIQINFHRTSVVCDGNHVRADQNNRKLVATVHLTND